MKTNIMDLDHLPVCVVAYGVANGSTGHYLDRRSTCLHLHQDQLRLHTTMYRPRLPKISYQQVDKYRYLEGALFARTIAYLSG